MFGGLDELDRLAVDLTKAGATVGIELIPVAHRAGNNMVRDAQENAPGGPSLRSYGRTLTYDVEVDGTTIVVEMGPDRDVNGQAKLANLLEFGVESRGIPPKPHIIPAGDREAPKFEHWLAEIAGGVL